MKKLLFMMIVLIIPIKVWAYGEEESPVMLAVYDEKNATLCFVYDVIHESEGTVDEDRIVKCGPFSFIIPAGTDGWSYDDYGWYFPPSTLYSHYASWSVDCN